MSTETLRSHYTKLIQTEIRQLERFRDQASRRSSNENVERFDKKIADLQMELTDDDTTRYNAFLTEHYNTMKLQQKSLCEKEQIRKEDHENKTKLEEYHKEENRLRRKDRFLQNQMKRDWEWLCTQDAKLPDYIRENLSRMPNNKGYIWRGIWYFGHRPEEDPNLLIMFERAGGETLIHEILYGRYRKVYTKNKNGTKTIVSEFYYKRNQ